MPELVPIDLSAQDCDIERDNQTLAQRNRHLSELVRPLPGSVPYDNYRPINVPARYEGQTLMQCVCAMHPHITHQQWAEWFERGHILRGNEPMPMSQPVRGGQQYVHLFPDFVEPEVNPNIRILRETETLIIVDKPAPLPVHPCGRFNHNTLISLLGLVYPPEQLRVVHRLDANTSGLLVLARDRATATSLRRQFEANEVDKRYTVLCEGHPKQDKFVCEQAISQARGPAGLRTVDENGAHARTEFQVRKRYRDGTARLEARPVTGRTNQIRIHLWSMGFPIVGDPSYRKDQAPTATQTLLVDAPPMHLRATKLEFKDGLKLSVQD